MELGTRNFNVSVQKFDGVEDLTLRHEMKNPERQSLRGTPKLRGQCTLETFEPECRRSTEFEEG